MRFFFILGLGILFSPLACYQTTLIHQTELQEPLNLSEIDRPYMMIRVGVSASASAEPGSQELYYLGAVAMNRLVQKAKLLPNQALVNVTKEKGLAMKGNEEIYILTLRADVIEFLVEEEDHG